MLERLLFLLRLGNNCPCLLSAESSLCCVLMGLREQVLALQRCMWHVPRAGHWRRGHCW